MNRSAVLFLALVLSYSAFCANQLPLILRDLGNEFQEALETCEKEGATYTIDLDAYPESIDISATEIAVPDIPIEQDVESSFVEKKEPARLKRFSWADHNGVSAVKNQGKVNCCWAFAVTSVFECGIKIRQKYEVDLSEQDLVSCNQFGFTMESGGDARAFYFFQQYGGVQEQAHPYTGKPSQCRAYLQRPFRLNGVSAIANNVLQIKTAIYNYGPVYTCAAVDKNFGFYSGGVFNHDCYDKLNHGLTIVGWDDTMGTRGCWIIKNSWGTDWGEQGYINVEYGKCKIGTGAVFIY